MATDVTTNCVQTPTTTPITANDINNCCGTDQHYCGQPLQPMPVLLRGSIARSIYERMQREEQLRQFDRQKWYCVESPLNEDLIKTFVQMDCDSETKNFLNVCYEKSDQYFTHLFHSIARTFLCLFMSSTSVNGLLGRGSMFVFSDNQFKHLLKEYLDLDITSKELSLDENNEKVINNLNSDKILMDLGAGDGKVTEIMAKYFGKTFVTEISPVMRKILTKKGFHVLEIEDWDRDGLTYDLISCLNVLDRCDKPLTMLDQIKSALRPKSGLLLLALVLPFSQYVEVNDSRRTDHRPTEVLPIEGQTFEQQLLSFKDNVLQPNGFEIIKWTKLPYLCEGDLDLTFYWLYDVVLLLKPIDH